MKPLFFLPLMTYPDQTSEGVIANAIDLARNQGAILHATTIEVTLAPVSDAWALILVDTDSLVSTAHKRSHALGVHLQEFVGEKCAAAGVKCTRETISISEHEVADTVARLARNYDLTLLQSASRFQHITEAVIFDSGRPVILYGDQSFSGRIDHVAIAWDGSRAAARAMGDAASLIAAAMRVSVIEVTGSAIVEDSVERRLVEGLSERGIDAENYRLAADQKPIGDVLQQKAAEIGADLLIMGGFGHSRMRQFVLGGATQDVLDDPRLPVLMSH